MISTQTSESYARHGLLVGRRTARLGGNQGRRRQMTKENYFKKVRAALRQRDVSLDLNMAETLRVCRLQTSGFSPVSTAKVIIANRAEG